MFATPNNNKDTPYQLPSNSFLQHLNRPPPDDSPTVVRTTLADDNHNKKPQMTLKEQERAIDKLTKDNFNLKLKISFLEERMVNNSPENMEQVFKENVENKVKIQQLEVELDRRQKLLVETKMLIDHLQMQAMAAQRQKGGELDADAHKELMHLRKEVAQLRQANAWSDIHERELVYQQRDEAEARLDEAQQEFALLEAKVGELDAENGALHDELQDAKDLASRAEQLQNQNTYLRDQVAEYQLRVRELESEIRHAGGTGNVLQKEKEASYQSWMQERENLLLTIDQLHAQLDSQPRGTSGAANINRQMQQEMFQLREEFSAAVHERNQALDELERLEDDYEQLKKDLHDLEQDYEQLRGQLDQGKVDGASLQKMQEMEKLLLQDEDDIKALEIEREDLLVELRELRQETEREQHLRHDAEQRERDAVQSLARSRRVSTRTGVSNHEYEQALLASEERWQEEADLRADVESRHKQLKHDLEALRAHAEKWQQKCNVMESLIVKLEDELEHYRNDQNPQLEGQVSKWRQECEELGIVLTDLEKENVRLQEHSHKLEALLKAKPESPVVRPNSVDSSLKKTATELKKQLDAKNKEIDELKTENDKLVKKIDRREVWINKTKTRLNELNERKGTIDKVLLSKSAVKAKSATPPTSPTVKTKVEAVKRTGAQAPTPKKAAGNRIRFQTEKT